MASATQVLQVLSEPKTLEELAGELRGTLEQDKIENALLELRQRGDVERKRLSKQCTAYWKVSTVDSSLSRDSKLEKGGSRTPGAISRLSSAAGSSCQARLSPFRSPARIPSPSLSGELQPPASLHTSGDPEGIARDVLKLRRRLAEVDRELGELSDDFHESELQVHIKRLHDYNEMKDVGQMLLGRMAEAQGTTTAEIYKSFGLDLGD